jgi:hypothetical protein
MTRRKGEITRDDLKREWPRSRIIPQFPHHVALPAERVRHPVNPEAIFLCCRRPIGDATHVLDAAHHSAVVVFCFAEDAEAFAERFGGKRLWSGDNPENKRPTRALVEDERPPSQRERWLPQ